MLQQHWLLSPTSSLSVEELWWLSSQDKPGMHLDHSISIKVLIFPLPVTESQTGMWHWLIEDESQVSGDSIQKYSWALQKVHKEIACSSPLYSLPLFGTLGVVIWKCNSWKYSWTLNKMSLNCVDSFIHRLFPINTCTVFNPWLGAPRCVRPNECIDLALFSTADLSILGLWYLQEILEPISIVTEGQLKF